jgi:hypothetical protein
MAKKKTQKKNRRTKPKALPMPREDKVRLWWTCFIALLLGLLLLEFAMGPHGENGAQDLPFFFAWFGFFSCAVIIVLSKFLGHVLKKPESYYGEK